MAKNAGNAREWVDGAVWVAPLGTAAPTAPTGLYSVASPSWREIGWLADGGVTETRNINSSAKQAWQNGVTIRTIRTADSRVFKFSAYEEQATVLGLTRPGSTVSVGSAATEVQTVTITGTPTGGTFSLTYNGQTANLNAYNVATATLQTALQALSTIGAGNVLVTGTAGSSYVLTFAGALANTTVGLFTAGSSLTGGTTPTISVARTTVGTAGTVTTPVKAFLGQDLRAWGFDFIDGAIQKRIIVPTGEVTDIGDIQYQDDLTQYDFTVTAYPDTNAVLYTEYSNNPSAIPS